MKNPPIRTISLHQYFASAMALGIKKNETRHWPTAYRGPLAIHAAKRPWRGIGDPDCPMAPAVWGALKVRDPQFAERGRMAFPYGAIVCVVNVIDCRKTEDVESEIQTYEDSLENFCGNYDKGRFAWITDSLQKLDKPIVTPGRQRFWNWQPPDDFELKFVPDDVCVDISGNRPKLTAGKWVRK